MRPLLGLAALVALSTACRNAVDNGVYVYNSPPAVSVTAPLDDTTFEYGQAITFRGVVSDDGGVDRLTIEWHSAIDGVLQEDTTSDSDGNVELVLANLSLGHHVVTLRALDEDAELGDDHVTIHVEGVPEVPSITVEHPLAGEKGGDGMPYRFMARVNDAQDDLSQLVVSLDSNVHGFVCDMYADGSGLAWCDEVLELGPHMLTFVVTDTDANKASAAASFEVVSPLDLDLDGDGFTPNGGDCNDANKTIYPGAPEICDGLDNDCNPATPIDYGTECTDDDGDGFTELQGDCDDANPGIYPGAPELPNGKDDDCDGVIDEGTVRYDDDGDGYCESPPCVNAPGTLPDCDDDNYLVNPGRAEICGDGIDNDCDGLFTKKDAIGCTPYYFDNDADGYGVPGATECHCDGGLAPYTGLTNNDCYDSNPNAFPGQTKFFSGNRGDGSFDYNCDYNQEERWVNTHVCDLEFFLICDDDGGGWTSGLAPNCGQQAQFADGCTYKLTNWNPIEYDCVRAGVTTKRQECR